MAPSFDCVSNVLENGSHFESWDNQGDTRQTHLSLSFFAAEEVVPLEAAHYKREIMIENSFTRSKKNQISGGSLSAAKTPIGVLDAGPCFSSWDNDKTSATRTSSISVEPYAKRRKLNEFCSSVFVSEVQPCWQKAVVFGGDEDFQCTPWNEGCAPPGGGLEVETLKPHVVSSKLDGMVKWRFIPPPIDCDCP
ncbi:hypothetical protein SUGI_0086340 [Cryptomeria japonica]|nr:hypothetical protein SUGI_0086340 [Cryptomeria japonica]